MRRKADSKRNVSERANESDAKRSMRRQTDSVHKSNKRRRLLSPEVVVAEFKSKIMYSADFVCTCCHRLMFREAVIALDKTKYDKIDPSVLDKVFDVKYEHATTMDGHTASYIYKTCHSALSRGSMPLLSKANGLDFTPEHEIPKVLSELNELETRLISLRIPFMKLVALPAGKQRKIVIPAVNVPSKLDRICSVLPRLPSEAELVHFQLEA